MTLEAARAQLLAAIAAGDAAAIQKGMDDLEEAARTHALEHWQKRGLQPTEPA